MKILGLDLGVSSVGWAIIETDEEKTPKEILGMGVRIIPMKQSDIKDFNKGQSVTPCSSRTLKRSARRCNFRYKMRRQLLSSYLSKLGMYPDDDALRKISPLELWGLRASAATPGIKLTLKELGRVLLHLNQKRGYRHSRLDNSKKEETQYVQDVNNRYREIKEKGITIGQEFYNRLQNSAVTDTKGTKVVSARLKEQVFPRHAYIEEFDRIMDVQKEFYPEILSDEVIDNFREAIYYQRPLKSCKHLVSYDELVAKEYVTKDGRTIIGGPKNSPVTSPLAQLCRLYEAVNNIRLKNLKNKRKKSNSLQPSLFEDAPRDLRLRQEIYQLTPEEKQKLVDHLMVNETLTGAQLLKLVGLKKSDGFVPDNLSKKGIKGNDTLIKINEALRDYEGREELLKFDLEIVESGRKLLSTNESYPIVSPECIHQPLYRLWHLLYSVSDPAELKNALRNKFGIEDEVTLDRLVVLDFRTPGYANKSTKVMREILPYLMNGFDYATSCAMIDLNHSDSLTKEANANRKLSDRLTLLPKNSLRQPMVERVLNQMINVVNALIEHFGPIDEVRVEMARGLKSSAADRSRTTANIEEREKENKKFAALIEQYGLIPNRKRIQKYKMWEESGHCCIYCGKPINVTEWLNGVDSEVEHIIPKSLFFDDSLSNKTCSCRDCNSRKNNMTAYDFMAMQGAEALNGYVGKVLELFNKKQITKTKRERLMTSKEEIPQDFIERDLRLTQYISKKACSVLREVIRDVWASSGIVTAYFRHQWGYDQIIHDLNIPRYTEVGMVRTEEYLYKGQVHTRQVIKDWTKREDHRHHSVDALTIALTRQGYVERLSSLNTQHEDIFNEMTASGKFKKGETLLIQWADSRPHFTVKEVADKVASIVVSTKGMNKLTTPGKRKIRERNKSRTVQEKLIIPRGALHEEYIYGKKYLPDGTKPLKEAFSNPRLISDKEIRKEIYHVIDEFCGDTEAAYKSIGKKNPILHPITKQPITSVKMWRDEYVIKKRLTSLKLKDIDSIIDGKIREMVGNIAKECKDDKALQQRLNEAELRLNSLQAPIRSVRLMTGLKPESMANVRKDENGDTIGYAKTGANHHIAYYRTPYGKVECVKVSFWDAVIRKQTSVPVLIKNPREAVDLMMNITDENLREAVASSLPNPNWEYLIHFRINDYFIVGLSDEEIRDIRCADDYNRLRDHLYRIQSVSVNDINFRLHTDTSSEINSTTARLGTSIRLKSYKAIKEQNPKRVKIDILGRMIITDD